MAKKLLCVLLSVLMVVSLLPTGLFADEDVDYSLWYWKDGETMVNKYYGDATDITLPTYKSDGTTLSVGIYNTIWGGSSITDSAGDSTIEIIRFPDTYTTIPTSSFRSNASLREVYLPSGLKIGNSNVFYIEYVLFPEGMTCSILDMFKGCTNPDLIIDIQSTTLTSLGSAAYHNAFQDVCGTIVVYSDDMYAMATAAVSTSTNCTATVVYGPVTEIDVTVDVSAVAEEDVPEGVSVSLYDGDEAVMTKSVTSSGNWERTLRLTGTTGSESYSVVAADIEGYTAEVTGDASTGFVVTYSVAATEVSASVVWSDTDSHDAVTLTLSTTSGDVATVELSDDNDWAGSFSVQNYDDNLVYTVTATEVEGYTYEVTGDTTNGFVVTYTAEETATTAALRGIYGGYGSTYNQETDSYSILCTDDLTTSQKEATVGTASVKFYFDGNSDFASDLQYQVAYGTVYLWNFFDGLVSTGQYADGNTLAMTGNSISYPLSITSVDDAYSITAGTGWTYDADNPVWTITKIEFLDSSGNVLLTLTEFSLVDEEEEVDYTFPIEGVEFATSSWSTTYDSTTGVATFGSWTGLGWWFGSSSTLELSELTITATSDIDWQVVVEYVDGTTST
ncbi:MAG: Cna B-type domain-containing protein, partial [Oscillospiraceae bacterium]|nr:Cna B-type domain-containing protein [Oscillospiraceae bacterium]